MLAHVIACYEVLLFVHICRTMSRRRRQTYNKEEVLAALFALSSDDESEDNLEDSEDGVYQFDIYTGKDNSGAGSVGLGDRVVMSLTETLNFTNTHVTFDNFFSSVALLDYLRAKNIFATCTVRSNRCNLPVIASVNDSMARVESKWCTRNSVGYVKRKDTKILHVMSTAFSPNAILNAKRTQKDGTSALVECPQSVLEYTKRMGGVDRFDRSRGHYSVSHKARRWWIRIFYFLLDTAVVNSFILYQSAQPQNPMTLLTFRVALFRGLVCGQSFRRHRSSLEGSSFMKYRVCGKKKNEDDGCPGQHQVAAGESLPRSDQYISSLLLVQLQNEQ